MDIKFTFLLIISFCHMKKLNSFLISPQKKSDYFSEIFRIGIYDFIEMQLIENPKIYTEYDFVIVGAGSAGSVIANRLTENQNHTVLLIEAGGNENLLHQIPMMAIYLQSTASNWGYKTVPQKKSCFGMYNNECAQPRGKVVGGSSSINYMIYTRGNRRDFDRWSEAGNTGWSYREVLPYFIKSEHSALKQSDAKYHGYSGPLNVEYPIYKTPMVDAFVKGCQQIGYKQVDYNGESQLGVSYVQGTTRKGRRCSAAQAYINPIRNRKNLHIITHSQATKILIDPATKTANGVEFLNRKKRSSVKARKEVIVSAGTINSPQLLMLSGVGPANNLEAIGIPIIKELPVGEIMYDHTSFYGLTIILNSTGSTVRVAETNLVDIQNFVQGKSSKFSLLGGVESLVFIKTPNSKEPADMPDIELILLGGGLASDEGTGTVEGVNLKRGIYNKVYKSLEFSKEDHYTMVIMLCHPKSVGKLWLHRSDPLQWPRIDPKYLENDEDIETLLYGIKASIKIMQSPAMKKLGARLHDIPIPGCENLHFGSDDYWRCAMRVLSGSLYHQVATCKMGQESDPTTVVNNELKVHGINNLRIADCSIIPAAPTAHTNAIAFMIGEKAADMIKASWR